MEDRPSHSSQTRTPLLEGRGRTNLKGERMCFQCNKFGHNTVNCPIWEVSRASGVAKGLSAQACDEIAWNAERRKYLRRGKLDRWHVQILLDTGCDHTMVLASLVDPSVVDHVSNKAPNLPVDILLGNDICPLGPESKDGWSFLVFVVWT